MNNNTKKGIEVFAELGNVLYDYLNSKANPHGKSVFYNEEIFKLLEDKIAQTEIENPWFTREFQLKNLAGWVRILEKKKLKEWLDAYPEAHEHKGEGKRVGTILAGNIPLVGFHDILSILISGHLAVTKMSSKDKNMYPALKEIIKRIDPEIAEKWTILEDEVIKDIDAVIATGSDNSSRYFHYYFGKYPHIIRKNRNSVAVLQGTESESQMIRLADDIFMYFGLGCRNVSKLFVPTGFEPGDFYPYMEKYAYVSNHQKYANNYDYQKAVHLVNKIQIYDNGFLILKNDQRMASPVGTLYYETYTTAKELVQLLDSNRENLQCIVTNMQDVESRVEFGESQYPGLDDYADNIDTLKFLFNLYKI